MKTTKSENAYPTTGATPGEKVYCAYNRSSGGLNHEGTPSPNWKDLPAAIRKHWEFTTEVMRRHLQKGLPYEDSITKAESWVSEGLKL